MKKIKYNLDVAERLDVFLNDQLPDLSRTKIQKLIKQEKIKVNKRTITPHFALKNGDEITISETEISLPEKAREKAKEIKKLKYEIIENHEDYLVVNKPAGIAVHKSGAETISLIDVILKDFPEIKGVGEDPIRPGIVHRLDKDVSGLLVIAKTQDSFNHLKKQFKKRLVKKSYQALVHGPIEKDEDTINFPITRASSGHKMAALPLSGSYNENIKSAITNFINLKKYINYTLLRIYTKTGRTHQIRAHMAAYGHPIVGDDLYGTRKTNEKNHKLGTKRIFLIADQLKFMDTKNKEVSFSISLGPDLINLLNEAK